MPREYRTRDRRNRGVRRSLIPPSLPGFRTRSEAFDELVLDALDRLERRWAKELATIEFAVEDVPPGELSADASIDESADEAIPLARSHQAGPLNALPRIVMHRRPIEARAKTREELSDLVLDVVIHEVARLLETTPAVIDPEGHGVVGDD